PLLSPGTRTLSVAAPSHPPPLHSFPTRRSSDLPQAGDHVDDAPGAARDHEANRLLRVPALSGCQTGCQRRKRGGEGEFQKIASRSEEHTSELQSPYDLVCRLLLEKKKSRRARPP